MCAPTREAMLRELVRDLHRYSIFLLIYEFFLVAFHFFNKQLLTCLGQTKIYTVHKKAQIMIT